MAATYNSRHNNFKNLPTIPCLAQACDDPPNMIWHSGTLNFNENAKSSAPSQYTVNLQPPYRQPQPPNILVLAMIQKYFLETIPPREIFAIDLVSEDAPITNNPSDLQLLLEEIAMPKHGMNPPHIVLEIYC